MRGRIRIYILTLFILSLSFRVRAEGDLYIEFRENKGQWDPGILYRAELNQGYLLITRQGLQYIFYEYAPLKHFKGTDNTTNENHEREIIPESDPDISGAKILKVHTFSLEFAGSSTRAEIEPRNHKNTYYNYFTGNDPSRWASHVQAYHEIIYHEIYPGIQFRLYSQNGFMKYDFIVQPGAIPQSIRLKYRGVDEVSKEFNNLYVKTSLGKVIENAPVTYQMNGPDTSRVECYYRLDGTDIAFDLPKGYDLQRTLIIDPLLVFSTYSGSTMDNWGNTATYDDHGNVYSGGTVWDLLGGHLPVTQGAYQTTFGGVWDVAILKFDSAGHDLLYGTYLGGSETETPISLIVNHQNELVIFGVTGSSDFPCSADAFSTTFMGGDSVNNALGIYNQGWEGIDYNHGSDFFIAKLSEDGSDLVSATYIGGTEIDGINNAPGFPLSRNYGDEFRGEVNIDKQDNIYIISNSSSPDFPIVNGFQDSFGGGTHDAVIAKFNPGLSILIWSTFLGGDHMDSGYGIKPIDNGYVVVAGGTMSEQFPVTQGAYQTQFGGDVDGFISRISANGDSLLSSTFVGTNDYDQVYFVDIDIDKEVYVYGQTRGNYPVSDSVYSNPNSGQFIHKFSADLSTSVFSTVIGSGSGSPDISPTAFLVNECENIFLSGWGGQINNPDFFPGTPILKYVGGNTLRLPITSDAFQSNTDGSEFYLMVLAKDARILLYSTFLGALNTGPGEHVDGGTSRFDKRGIVYHAICACRDESQFPTTPGVWSNTNRSLNCNNGVFKFDLASLKAGFTTDTPEFDHPGITQDCYPFEVVFLNRSKGGKLFRWDFGDDTSPRVQDDSVYHEYDSAGSYLVTLYALDENTCQKIDVATGELVVFEPHFIIPGDETICQGDRITLEADGAIDYKWSPSTGLNDPTLANPSANPDSSTTYYLSMTDENTCEVEDSVLITVIPSIGIDFQSELVYDCKTPAGVKLTNYTTNADRYTWNMGDGNILEDQDIAYQYKDTGDYIITMKAWGGEVCSDSAHVNVHINAMFVPNVITPNIDSKNENFTIITDAPVNLRIFNRWGGLVFKSERYKNDWDARDLTTGVYFYEFLLNNQVTCNGWLEVLK